MTPAEAGEVLGVGKRNVYLYVHRGWLHPVYDRSRGIGAPLLLQKEEVSALAEVLENQPDFTAVLQRATQAYVTSRALERRVDRLEQLVGAKYTSPPLDSESVASLYMRARADLEIPPTDQESVEFWTRTFMSIGEEFFDALEAYVGEKSWEVFHDLGRAIIEEAEIGYAGDEEAQGLYRCYERARRNLRTVLFFYIRTRFGTRQALRMFRDETNLHERVKSYLNLGQGAPATPRRSGRPSLELVK